MRNEAKGILIQNIQFLFVLYDNINSLLATLFLWANRDGEKSPQQQPVALYGLFKKQLAKTDLVSIDRQETGPGILSDLIKGLIQSWIWAQPRHSSKHVISAMKERREGISRWSGRWPSGLVLVWEDYDFPWLPAIFSPQAALLESLMKCDGFIRRYSPRLGQVLINYI